MKLYRTKAKLEFNAGVLGLTEKQAAPRAKALELVGRMSGVRGKFKVISHVEFKAGEVIGLDAVPKVYGAQVEPVANGKAGDADA